MDHETNDVGAFFESKWKTKDGNAYWYGEVFGRKVKMFETSPEYLAKKREEGKNYPSYLVYESIKKEESTLDKTGTDNPTNDFDEPLPF